MYVPRLTLESFVEFNNFFNSQSTSQYTKDGDGVGEVAAHKHVYISNLQSRSA